MIFKLVKPIIVALLLLPAVMQPGYAEQMSKASIAVIDMQQIMRELAVVQDMNAQVRKIEDATGAELETAENKLKEEKSQIERQKALVTPEAFAEKQAVFNRKVAEFRTQVNDKTTQIQRSRINALNKIKDQMFPVMRDVIDEYGATLVLDVNEILFAEKPLNLTEELVERLNKKLKNIKVELVPLKKS
tara:strand:+ start:12909 stop:13475 length:567 start_codon:yes stop_codon:yes gene_type:complete